MQNIYIYFACTFLTTLLTPDSWLLTPDSWLRTPDSWLLTGRSWKKIALFLLFYFKKKQNIYIYIFFQQRPVRSVVKKLHLSYVLSLGRTKCPSLPHTQYTNIGDGEGRLRWESFINLYIYKLIKRGKGVTAAKLVTLSFFPPF